VFSGQQICHERESRTAQLSVTIFVSSGVIDMG
jgi:hypothetical protein